MAEYYALLNRAVEALQRNDEASRRDIYVKARSALIKQLKAIDPPLPAAEISKQRLSLEDAIRRIEREAVEAAAASMLSEAEISRRAEDALKEALTGGPAEHSAHFEASAEPEDEGEEDTDQDRDDEPDEGTAFAEVVTPRPQPRTVPQPPPFQRGPKVTDVETVPTQPSSQRDSRRGWERSSGRRRERRSAVGQLIWFVIIVVILGGIGYLVWANWDEVSDLLDSITGNDSAETADEGGNAAAGVGIVPAGEEDGAAPPAADQPAADDPDADAPDAGAPAPDEPVRQVGDEPVEEPAVTVASEASFTLVPADPAIPPEVLDATVRWALQDGETGPVIAGDLSVPTRGLTIMLRIGLSPDPNFSHEVLVLANSDPANESAPVSAVTDLWVKASEDGNELTLNGAPEVGSDFYFIELPIASEIQNEVRLTDSPWFEVALEFASGEEGTVTFSKGSAGEDVFDEAFAAWE